MDGRIRRCKGLTGRVALHRGVGAAPQSGRCYGPEIGQESSRTSLVFFIGRQQNGGGVAVLSGSGPGKGQRLVHLCAAGFILCHRQHRANVPIEQLTVQGSILCLHALCRAVAGTVGRGDRGHGKADTAAPDGGQDACQRIRRQQEQHPFGRLLHDFQQGVG